ncbi:MAG: NAD(P)H-hydrate dehydratase [Micavibrio sp.]|nr:NAD(P)H-hydrate dehydratase [Micavibrio sp.]
MSQKNSPKLWQNLLPIPDKNSHKYERGHAVILASDSLTGATRLATDACSRMGAGLVSVVAHEKGDVYRATLSADIMVTEEAPENLKKVTAILGGCGGLPEELRPYLYNKTYDVVRVFDANAIPLTDQWAVLDENCILTPHEGEFVYVFGEITGSREEVALDAAQKTGAIVVLKGGETIIAAPDGRVVINEHASPYLAKAGTGDVLAGMIAGLAAQGVRPFEAACAAIWIHGEAGLQIGSGLVAGDIINTLPAVLKKL